jgi:hypothetical protein
MIATLRTMTRKSKLGFGKYKDKTIQEMLDLKRYRDLISPYFGLTSINYQEDILVELRISEEYRIDKPGSNKELHQVFLDDKWYRARPNRSGADRLKRKFSSAPPLTRGYLQSKNHGR